MRTCYLKDSVQDYWFHEWHNAFAIVEEKETGVISQIHYTSFKFKPWNPVTGETLDDREITNTFGS